MKPIKIFILANALLLLMPTLSAQAGDKTKTGSLDCGSGSLAAQIAKLDTSISNILEFTGDCVEDIVIKGHRDLTLIGLNGASITATVTDELDGNPTTALSIFRSNFTIESVTLYSGNTGAVCNDRSSCVFRDVEVIGGWNGLAVQSQSSADLIGSSSISGSSSIGLGVFGASSLNVRPHWSAGYDPGEEGYEISGHGWAGVLVQDGSFFRSDNATIELNGSGVIIRRGAIAKLYGGYVLPGINNNGTGVDIYSNSTVDIDTSIRDNANLGLGVGALTSVRVQMGNGQFSGNGQDIDCYDDTARGNVCP